MSNVKKCRGCGFRKTVPDDFYVRRRSRDGLTSRCRVCIGIQNKEATYYRRRARELAGIKIRVPTGDEVWKRRITSDGVKSVIATKIWEQTKDTVKSLELAEVILSALGGLHFPE